MDDAKRKALAVKLGLSEDASEADVLAGIDDLIDDPSGQTGRSDLAPAADQHGTTGPSPEKGNVGGAPTAAGPPAVSPDLDETVGKDKDDTTDPDTSATVTLDRDTFNRLKAGSDAALAREEKETDKEIVDLVTEAVRVGKIYPARRQHWVTSLKADFVGGKEQLSKLAEGLVPVKERGTAGNTAEGGVAAGAGEGLPSDWFPEIRAGQSRAKTPVTNAREG